MQNQTVYWDNRVFAGRNHRICQ